MPTDVDPLVPIFPMHGGSTAAEADAMPAYMQRGHGGSVPSHELHETFGRGGTNDEMGSLFGDDDGSASVSESLTTASEYSAL